MTWLAKRLFVLSIIVVVAVFALLGSLATDDRYAVHDIRAVAGVIDMSAWNPDQAEIIALDGEWEFYWGQLLSSTDFTISSEPRNKPHYMEVPSDWNGKLIDDNVLPGEGYATYRLKLINLPAEERSYAIKKSNIRFASTVFVNGNKLMEDGMMASSAALFRPGNTPQYDSFFVSGDDEIEIIIHVSNFEYLNAGITGPIYFGEQSDMLMYQDKIVARDYIISGILFTLSVIFMLCFIATLIYHKKDYSLLFFSFICLLFAAYNGLMGERSLVMFFENVSFEFVYRMKDMISLLTFIVLAVVFHYLQKSLFTLRVAQALAAILGAICLLVAFLPLHIYINYYLVAIVIFQFLLLSLLIRIGYHYVRSLENRMRILMVFIAVMSMNVYSVDLLLFSLSFKHNYSIGQLFLILFSILLIATVVIRFFEAYRAVDDLKNQLLLADQVKDEFLSNTSHELRTPLNAIVNIADTLLKGVSGSFDEEQTKNLQIISRSGRRLAHLVNDLLDYSRMKHGDINLAQEAVELRGAVDAVMTMHQFLLQGKPVMIKNEVPSQFPALMADGNRLNQILHNLIGNAVKYTESGSVSITARVVRDQAEIRVIDTGPGIDPAMHERIFLPYEQLEHARGMGGSGLGLNITKNLVELQGGTIQIESEVGRGTTILFTLPVYRLTSHPVMQDSVQDVVASMAVTASEVASGLSFPYHERGTIHESILIADDDIANLQTMMNLMRIEGYSFTVVNGGQAVLAEISRNPKHSLVVLDIMMPEVSGFEVLRQLRERFSPYELPILMLTARNRSQDVRLSLEYGANDIVGKPFELEELTARIRSLMNLRASVSHANQAEISFIRSQIKPHFLYNALNSIAEMCVVDPPQAERLIIYLSRYLRKSFDFKQLDSYTTLDSELELVQAYVTIEQVRFGSRLHVVYEVDADGMMLIPPLILQPLVENAIRHGITTGTDGGTVKVTVKADGHARVRFVVEDDGCGMSEHRLEEIVEREEGSQGVGLWNIRKHLRLLYGTDIRIESWIGIGTKVSFDLPIRMKEGA